MARYPLNQPIRVSTTIKDVTGTLVNATALTLAVTKPDASVQSYASPANDGPGLYHQDIPAADLQLLGHYQYTWTATGTGAGVAFSDFDVFDPLEPAVLPLQDGKDQLNIPQTVTTYDSELQAYIATIQASLESFTGGPLVNRTVTAERAEMVNFQTAILVRQRPLVSVTSVTSASGGTIDISAGLDLDQNAGVIRRKLGLPFYGPFFQWLPQVLVTYVAGWGTSVPATFNLVSRIILAHLWETQHGPSVRPTMGGAETVTLPGWGYAIPNRAAELLTNGSLNGMPFTLEAYA
jgi:hypothetical protein